MNMLDILLVTMAMDLTLPSWSYITYGSGCIVKICCPSVVHGWTAVFVLKPLEFHLKPSVMHKLFSYGKDTNV